MTPTSALHFTEDRIRLLAREADGWAEIASVLLEEADLGAGLAHLRDLAGGAPCLLMLPATHVVYACLPSAAEIARERGDLPADPAERAAAALEGLTVYAPHELAHDWVTLDDGAIALAAVARETLAEAQDFVQAHGFTASGFSALPDDDQFPRLPDFGPVVGAAPVAPATTAAVLPDPIEDEPVWTETAASPDQGLPPVAGTIPLPVAQTTFDFAEASAPAPLAPAAPPTETVTVPSTTETAALPEPQPEPAPMAEVVRLHTGVNAPDLAIPDDLAPPPPPAQQPRDEDRTVIRDAVPPRPRRPAQPEVLEVPQARVQRAPWRNAASIGLALAVFAGVAALWAGYLRDAPAPEPPPATQSQPAVESSQTTGAPGDTATTTPPEAATGNGTQAPAPAATPSTPAPEAARAAAPAAPEITAVAPAPVAMPPADAPPAQVPTAVAPDQIGRLDASGQIVPTPEGVMTPDGYWLFAGRPANAPPSRPESVIRAAAEAAGVEPEPQPLPWPLVAPPVSATPEVLPESEGSDEPGASPRPTRRPGGAASAPAAAISATTETAATPAPSATGGKSSPRPRARPAGLNTAASTPPVAGGEAAVDAAVAEAMAPAAGAGSSSPRPKRRPKGLSASVDQALAEAQAADAEVARQAAAAAEAAKAASAAASAAATQQARAEQEAAAQANARQEAEAQARAQAAAEAAAAAARLQAEAQSQAAAAAAAAAAAQAAAQAKADAEARARAEAAAAAEADRAARESERQAALSSGKPRFQHGGKAALDGRDIDEPEPVGPAPKGPTPQGVARQATQANVLDMGRTTLIGTFGGGRSKRALIRTSSGRITKVKLGDRFDGGTVVQINDGEMIYQKGGRLVALKLLRGG